MSSNNPPFDPNTRKGEPQVANTGIGRELDNRRTDLERAVLMHMTAGPYERLEAIWRFYEQQSGSSLHRPATDQEREQVSAWMLRRRAVSYESFELRANYFRSLAHRTPGEKANSLVQTTCGGCEPLVNGDRFVLNALIPIDVEPWSAQSTGNKVAIREAVRTELRLRSHSAPLAASFCLTVIAFTPRARRQKDVDNLVKGLLDSLKGVLYEDDRQVQCLTTRRVLTNARRGAYLLAARAVHPYDADVVYDDSKPLKIVSGSRIVI